MCANVCLYLYCYLYKEYLGLTPSEWEPFGKRGTFGQDLVLGLSLELGLGSLWGQGEGKARQ